MENVVIGIRTSGKYLIVYRRHSCSTILQLKSSADPKYLWDVILIRMQLILCHDVVPLSLLKFIRIITNINVSSVFVRTHNPFVEIRNSDIKYSSSFQEKSNTTVAEPRVFDILDDMEISNFLSEKRR